MVFLEAFRPGDDHGAERIRALDVGIVIDLDPLRQILQPEHTLHALEQMRLGGALRQFARQRLAGIGRCALDQLALFTADGAVERHLAVGLQAQRLGQQVGILDIMRHQDQARRRLVVIELRDEGGEHLAGLDLAVMAREEGLIAPVLAGAEEEDLDAGAAAILGDGDHIGFLDALRIDALVGGDSGDGADPVAQARGALIVERLRGGLHALLQILAQGIGLAAQEIARLSDQLVIGGRFDQPDAGRGAALDLVQHAGARAALIDAVGTGAHQEGFLQRIEGLVHGTHGGEGAEIIALHLVGAAMLGQLRRRMVAADQDIGKALVVAQQHIIARLEALDQIGLEQQRLGLGLGDDEFHRPGQRDHQGDAIGMAAAIGIIGNAILQIARLADIQDRAILGEHAVDTGL